MHRNPRGGHGSAWSPVSLRFSWVWLDLGGVSFPLNCAFLNGVTCESVAEKMEEVTVQPAPLSAAVDATASNRGRFNPYVNNGG